MDPFTQKSEVLRALAAAVDAFGVNEHGHPALFGHDPVVDDPADTNATTGE